MLTLSHRRQTGFTLIEILIVAALIGLLAGIAVINIQRAYVDNQRKATYGEVRNVATALAFAFEDIGLYPKLCFLQQNDFFIAPPQAGNLNQPGPFLVSGFEYMGYEVNQPATLAQRIIKNWAKGLGSQGYFAAGVGRRGMFQGRRGGMVKMEIPMEIYPQPVIGGGQALAIYDWPADPWGRPYVVYMLYQAGVLANGLPDARFVDKPTRAPNYVLAVVSYGPNGIPGGPSQFTTADVSIGRQLWLFTRDRSYPTESDFRCLRPDEYTPDRLYAWSHVKLLGEDPNDPGNPLSYIGVIDPGSDDIVYDFY
ncbi:hypothetical protein AMJ85_03575 [candidate division BRC1 bacterium SM23_51]|nr:MAG: hypothetical protein AMJ85_03575 [candidate division BRC1 bacterium SM23_51]